MARALQTAYKRSLFNGKMWGISFTLTCSSRIHTYSTWEEFYSQERWHYISLIAVIRLGYNDSVKGSLVFVSIAVINVTSLYWFLSSHSSSTSFSLSLTEYQPLPLALIGFLNLHEIVFFFCLSAFKVSFFCPCKKSASKSWGRNILGKSLRIIWPNLAFPSIFDLGCSEVSARPKSFYI